MLYARFAMPFLLIIGCLLIDPLMIANAKDAPKLAYLAAPRATVSTAQWFSLFDTIQAQSKIPSKERNQGAILMMRGMVGLGEPKEYEEANTILRSIASRYNRAAQQIERLPNNSATDSLRSGYSEWYRGNAKLSEDCIAVRTLDEAQRRYRKPTQEEINLLMTRKKMLDQLLNTCQYAELYVRSRNGCALPRPEAFE
jgi:hypothetical protein